ncbi:MAG: hypothetical protein HQ517_03545 [SAR324 cluster bacterium]|nr:hypothetical protein [SAR324 cluster bacterium]
MESAKFRNMGLYRIIGLCLWVALFCFHDQVAYSAEKKFDGIFSGTQKLSSAAANECALLSGAPSIKVQDGVISGIGFFQDIKGSVSGSRIVFQNSYGKSGLRYEGTISRGNSDYVINGVFSETSGSVCRGNFVLSGGDVSVGVLGETDSSIIDRLRKYSPLEELLSRRSTMNQIVDGVFVADKPEFTPGLWELKANTVLTDDAQVLNIPLSYQIGTRFKLAAEMPLVWSNNELFKGNLSGSAVSTSGTFESQVLLNSIIFDLPVGDESISAGGGNLQIGQAWIKDALGKRLFLSYYYRYTGVSDNLDTGDSLNVTMGLNNPWNNSSIYGIISSAYRTESTYNGTKLGDKSASMDLAIGLLNKPNAFRIGLNLPVLTFGSDYLNSERLISLDIGYSFE